MLRCRGETFIPLFLSSAPPYLQFSRVIASATLAPPWITAASAAVICVGSSAPQTLRPTAHPPRRPSRHCRPWSAVALGRSAGHNDGRVDRTHHFLEVVAIGRLQQVGAELQSEAGRQFLVLQRINAGPLSKPPGTISPTNTIPQVSQSDGASASHSSWFSSSCAGPTVATTPSAPRRSASSTP